MRKLFLFMGIVMLVLALTYAHSYSNPTITTIIKEGLERGFTQNKAQWIDGVWKDYGVKFDHMLYSIGEIQEKKLPENGNTVALFTITITIYGYKDKNKVNIVIVRDVGILFSPTNEVIDRANEDRKPIRIQPGWSGIET